MMISPRDSRMKQSFRSYGLRFRAYWILSRIEGHLEYWTRPTAASRANALSPITLNQKSYNAM